MKPYERVKEFNIMDEDWDALIILDACRYDFFSRFYERFLKGDLRKVWSSGSCTQEWFYNTFKEKYKDTVYFSANPYINSMKFINRPRTRQCFYFNCIRASNHFKFVVDVWLYGWDRYLGTVLPNMMNKLVLSKLDKTRGHRLIIHFIQPHAPYITPHYFIQGFQRPDPRKAIFLSNRGHPVHKILKLIDLSCKPLDIGNGMTLQLGELLGVPPISPLDAVRRHFGIKGLRKAYAENLLIVLEYLTDLIPYLPGKVVITSDHGEFLGERFQFSHPCKSKHRIVRCVPWLEVNKVMKVKPYFKRYPLKLKLKIIKRELYRSSSK